MTGCECGKYLKQSIIVYEESIVKEELLNVKFNCEDLYSGNIVRHSINL